MSVCVAYITVSVAVLLTSLHSFSSSMGRTSSVRHFPHHQHTHQRVHLGGREEGGREGGVRQVGRVNSRCRHTLLDRIVYATVIFGSHSTLCLDITHLNGLAEIHHKRTLRMHLRERGRERERGGERIQLKEGGVFQLSWQDSRLLTLTITFLPMGLMTSPTCEPCSWSSCSSSHSRQTDR